MLCLALQKMVYSIVKKMVEEPIHRFQGFSIWLCPTKGSKEESLLSELLTKIATEKKTVPFSPHATLSPPVPLHSKVVPPH